MEISMDTTGLPNDALLYWIHCNRCFEIYSRKERRVFLLTCQHVSCENCMKPTEDKDIFICPICNKTVRVRLLGNAMPPYIKEIFHPQPWGDGLAAMHIMKFQSRHRIHFENGMMRRGRDCTKLIQINESLRTGAKSNFEDIERKRHERKRTENRVRKISEKLKQITAEKAKLEAAHNAMTRQPPSSTTEESGIGTSPNIFESRLRFPSSSQRDPLSRRAVSAMGNTSMGPNLEGPDTTAGSFSTFTYRLNSFDL